MTSRVVGLGLCQSHVEGSIHQPGDVGPRADNLRRRRDMTVGYSGL